MTMLTKGPLICMQLSTITCFHWICIEHKVVIAIGHTGCGKPSSAFLTLPPLAPLEARKEKCQNHSLNVKSGFKDNIHYFRKSQKYPGIQGHFLEEMTGGKRVEVITKDLPGDIHDRMIEQVMHHNQRPLQRCQLSKQTQENDHQYNAKLVHNTAFCKNCK